MFMLNKICIIGGPGSGKSTLANNLSEILNLPAIHIDELYENKDWKFDDREKIEKKLLDKINNTDKWIIDGTYTETLEERLNKCDLMIFLDFSTIKLLKGVFKRRLQNMNISVKNLGWNERISVKFIKYVLFFNKKKRKKINDIIKDNKKCIILKNRKEVELFKKYLKITLYLKI
jgi:adenylate kinase family enzyme